MAYILGFIATDGCLTEHANGYHGLNITSKDKGLLKLIKIEMQAGHKISKKKGGHQLQIRNRVIYNDLLCLGLTPRKSKTLRFPKIPKEFLGSFIKGCFDGDGSVSVWREPRWRHSWQIKASFYGGSKPFLESLKSNLAVFGNLSKGTINKCGSCYKLHYGIEDSMKLCRFIYEKADCLCLKRKQKQFEFFKKVRPNKFEEHQLLAALSSSPV